MGDDVLRLDTGVASLSMMRTSGLIRNSITLHFAAEARRQLASGAARHAVETCKLGLARYPEHAAGYVVLAAAYRALGEEQRSRLVLERGYQRTGLESLRQPAIPGSDPTAFEPVPAEKHDGVDAASTDEHVVAADFQHHDLPMAVPAESSDRSEARGVGTPRAEREREVSATHVEVEPAESAPHADDEPAVTATLGEQEPVSFNATNLSAARTSTEESISTEEPPVLSEHPASRGQTSSQPEQEHEAVDIGASDIPERDSIDTRDEPPAVRQEAAPIERVALLQRVGVRSGERASPALAMHSGKNAHRLRSANLRLIPGLEYAPLRAQESSRRLAIAPIMDDALPDWQPRRRVGADDGPPLPEYPVEHAALASSAPQVETPSTVPSTPAPSPAPTSSDAASAPEVAQSPRGVDVLHMISAHAPLDTDDSTPIDALARRLEGARIAPVGELSSRPHHVFEPSIVSDTLAEILVAQRAYGEAIKAFMTLARSRPEKLAYYEERIAEMKMLMREEHHDDEE